MKISKKLIALSATITLATACVGPDDDEDNQSGDPVVHTSPSIDADITWSGTNIVENSMEVNAALTIEPCSRIEFSGSVLAHVRDGGSINAVGTDDCPIIFTSSDSAPAAGDWQRFDIWSSASNSNRFEHVIFEYGGADQWGSVWVESGARVAFSNVDVRHNTDHGFYFENGANITELSSIHFENIGGYLARLDITHAATATDITSAEGAKEQLWVASSSVDSAMSLENLEVAYDLAGLQINDELTVEAGVTLQMAPNALVHVRDGGSIKVNGSTDSPVVIQSNKSTPAAGDWQRFDIWNSASAGSSFSHTTIRHGGGSGTYGSLWLEDSADVTLDTVTFEESNTCDVYLENGATVDATDTTYTEC